MRHDYVSLKGQVSNKKECDHSSVETCAGYQFLQYAEPEIEDLHIAAEKSCETSEPIAEAPSAILQCQALPDDTYPKSCSLTAKHSDTAETTVTLEDTFHASEPVSLRVRFPLILRIYYFKCA